MNDQLKSAALFYALGDDNLEDIVQLGGIQSGTTALVMRSVIERIKTNVQARPKPRWGFVVDTDGRLKIYTPRWELRLRRLHYTLTDRETGEIVAER
jgi:hypothetical protein